MSNSNQFDAIVIGSGLGGLTVAAILSKLNHKKVLILEQHYVVGGYTHEFARESKFKWDVGLHYVGNMGKGELGRKIFDYLTNGNLKWNKMPDPFEKFVYPDFTFEQSCDPIKFKEELISKFPQEKPGIEQYFWDITNLAQTIKVPDLLSILMKLFGPRLRKIERLTTKEYLDRNFQDPKLKALLAFAYFDASDRGAIYGIPYVPERLGKKWLRAKTPIKHLYLTGMDVVCSGIMPALIGGIKTAGVINGKFGFYKIMSTIFKESARPDDRLKAHLKDLNSPVLKI